jgi:hypothetical protein
MPIYKRGAQKIHFIHIPKTGGMTIRDMLERSGWHNLYDKQKGDLFLADNKPYHGHMPYSYWKDWDAAKDCDFEFAIVRNPITRMSSLVEMHLRSFFLEKMSHVWAQANLPGNESSWEPTALLFQELGLLGESWTNDQVISLVLNVVIPEDPEIAQQVASDNNVTMEEHRQVSRKNGLYLTALMAAKEVEKHTGKSINNVSWIDLLAMYLDLVDVDNFERHGVAPCPMYMYLSPETHIYKFENLESVIDDLVSRGIIALDRSVHLNLYPKFRAEASSSWSDNPEVRDTFFNLFGPDFERFDYDRSTPFPNMKENSCADNNKNNERKRTAPVRKS